MIYRPEFTIEVSNNEVQYASGRFDIIIRKKSLTEFEKDLLRWMFAGKELFDLPDGMKISYRYYDRSLYITEARDDNGRIDSVEINGETFPVLKNYIYRGRYVIPGKDPVTLWISAGVVIQIIYNQDNFQINIAASRNIPDFIMDFIRHRDVKVLERYLPFDEKLLLKLWTKRKEHKEFILSIWYNEKKMYVAELKYKDGFFEGPGVFRDGIAMLRIPIESMPSLKESFKFGFIPREYAEKIIVEYPPLDPSTEMVTRLSVDSKNVVEFYGRDCCSKAWTDFRHAFVKIGNKKKRASLKSLKKYLKEIGLLE